MRIVIFLTMLPKKQRLCYYTNMNRQDELIQALSIEFENSSKEKKTKEILATLTHAWEIGLTNIQAAKMIGVPPTSLAEWLNTHPLLKELRDMCYAETNALARKNIHRAIKKGSVETSKWFLERTDPEFSKKDNVAPVQVNIISVADREKELKKFMERFTDAGVIDTVITEEREVCPVGEGEDTTALQEGQRITG